MKASRFLSFLLAVLLVVPMVPALAEDAPVITIMYPSANIPSEDNPVIQALREATGVNVQEIVLTYNEYATKIAALIASQELPDIFLSNGKDMTLELATYGAILPLDDLLEEHGQDVLAVKENQLRGVCTIDGKVYAVPVMAIENSAALALRKDWLDNLGLDVPDTLEEYYEVLRAFTYDDPNKNGENDTIGLGVGGLSHIFGAFGINGSYLNWVDGQAIPKFMHPNYLEAITYVNKLYNEGLYEPEFMTIEWMAMLGKLWNGIYGAFEFNPNGTTQNWLGRYTEDPKPEFVYTIIRGADGVGGTPRTIMDTGYAAVISSKCQNPEAAMKLINFFCTPYGDQLAVMGIEGTHFEWTDKDAGLYKLLEPYASDAALWREEGVVYGNFMERNYGYNYMNLNEVTRSGKQLSVDNNLPDAYIYQKTAIEEELGSLLGDIISEAEAALITCAPADVAALYESYKETYLANGGQDYIDQATEIYMAQEGLE